MIGGSGGSSARIIYSGSVVVVVVVGILFGFVKWTVGTVEMIGRALLSILEGV